MSNAQKRAEIAAALTTAGQVHGYARPPAVPAVGDAWPRWRGAERDGGLVQTWAVIVVLPQDELRADEWVDQYGYDLANALEDAGVFFVTGIEPAKVQVESGDMYALMITGRSE